MDNLNPTDEFVIPANHVLVAPGVVIQTKNDGKITVSGGATIRIS